MSSLLNVTCSPGSLQHLMFCETWITYCFFPPLLSFASVVCLNHKDVFCEHFFVDKESYLTGVTSARFSSSWGVHLSQENGRRKVKLTIT